MGEREVLNQEILPCGCIIRQVIEIDDSKIFEVVPCRNDCQNLYSMLHLSKELNKPVSYRMAP